MKKLLYIILITVSLASCQSSYDLSDSIYIYDDEYPDLPAYTEWGYNTFGAYYERDVFISDYEVPSKVINRNNCTEFSLNGELRSGHNGGEMSIKFILKDFNPQEYVDLIALNDSVIDLTDSRCKVTRIFAGVEDTLSIISGELNFKRVQHLLVDKKSVESILSGLFTFKTIIDSEPVTISRGRFDVGIGYENFYSY